MEQHAHDLSDLTGVILVGGLGTRLRPAVADRPKVLAPVRGRPFLAYLLDQLASAGVRRAVLCTGYRAEQVVDTFGDSHAGPRGTVALAYSREDEPLGTGGAIALAARHADGNTAAPGPALLVMNGDSYCHADLLALRAFHDRHRAAGTLQLASVADTSRFGRVQVDPRGEGEEEVGGPVVKFEEKGGAGGPGWINAGIYLLSRELVNAIPRGRAVSIEREVFPAWVSRGLFAYGGRGRAGARAACFLDIGTPESYTAAEAFFAGMSDEDVPGSDSA